MLGKDITKIYASNQVTITILLSQLAGQLPAADRPSFVTSLPINVILNAQQVVGHGLQRELMQERRHRIKATIQNEQLSTRLVWTLDAAEQKLNTFLKDRCMNFVHAAHSI